MGKGNKILNDDISSFTKHARSKTYLSLGFAGLILRTWKDTYQKLEIDMKGKIRWKQIMVEAKADIGQKSKCR